MNLVVWYSTKFTQESIYSKEFSSLSFLGGIVWYFALKILIFFFFFEK